MWCKKYRGSLVSLCFLMSLLLNGCGHSDDSQQVENQLGKVDDARITVVHQLGTLTLEKVPKRVAAFDMNDVDILDQLGVPIAGMPKDYVPHFLSRYAEDDRVVDLGAIVRPNLESVYRLKPDLILISPIQAQSYPHLSDIAPTLHFDWDLLNSHGNYLDALVTHIRELGEIFERQPIAEEKIFELTEKVAQVRSEIDERSERALILLHNQGSFSSFGVRSRYGFVYDTLGVKPASLKEEPGLHGQPISNEFIRKTNPDIIFIIDRTAVMEHQPQLNYERLKNPLIQQTEAWKNHRVVFVDAETWYVSSASITSLKVIANEVLAAYKVEPELVGRP